MTEAYKCEHWQSRPISETCGCGAVWPSDRCRSRNVVSETFGPGMDVVSDPAEFRPKTGHEVFFAPGSGGSGGGTSGNRVETVLVGEGGSSYAVRAPATLPTDAKTRKDAPIARGVLDYFPDALFAVAELSRIGNEQHNPGQPMHWAKEKSTDHADCILRHLIDRGTIDTDGIRHATKVAWRALALLQIELDNAK